MRRAGQVCTPRGQVNACQDNFGEAFINQALNLFDDNACRHRARVAAPKWNDAKRAAMVAAILHLNIGALAAKAVDQMPCCFAHGHNVIDLNLLSQTNKVRQFQAIG